MAGTVLALAPFGLPSGALASTTCQAPPGTSAIDQYCEALPSPGSSGHHKHSKPVSNSTTKQLEKQGPTGQAVLNLADSSGDANVAPAAPKPKKHHRRHHSRHAATPSPVTPKPASGSLPAPSSNPLSAVGSAIGTGSSTGAVLLWILVALAVLMGGTAFIGHRRRARES
ncbi:MAG TPA: hypothetical protein VJU60_09385 [Thermoleophilaceae bacterium]|nr:hypothetical protein [Thermoleophilaceae bacterium]